MPDISTKPDMSTKPPTPDRAVSTPPVTVPAINARVGNWYTHVATGNLYEVIALAMNERDLTYVVVYRSTHGVVWCRPRSQFEDGRFTIEREVRA